MSLIRSFPRLVSFAATLSICVALVQTETVGNSFPKLQNDNLDTFSGAGPIDVSTKAPVLGHTENPSTYEFEDITHSLTLDEADVVLGPGAITAIVIAVFLGASVLLALIVITLRKFTAS